MSEVEAIRGRLAALLPNAFMWPGGSACVNVQFNLMGEDAEALSTRLEQADQDRQRVQAVEVLHKQSEGFCAGCWESARLEPRCLTREALDGAVFEWAGDLGLTLTGAALTVPEAQTEASE